MKLDYEQFCVLERWVAELKWFRRRDGEVLDGLIAAARFRDKFGEIDSADTKEIDAALDRFDEWRANNPKPTKG